LQSAVCQTGASHHFVLPPQKKKNAAFHYWGEGEHFQKIQKKTVSNDGLVPKAAVCAPIHESGGVIWTWDWRRRPLPKN
jgi:hypothetical protein